MVRPTRSTWRRQRDKIVSAINTANADIVSLEELENSAKFGKPRDFAITQLVNALNVGNPGKWAFAPSPTGPDLPALGDEDVIRTGFIYQPARVATVGLSKILVGSAAFGNAREPLAQAFKMVGSPNADGFAVVVNHFKSKGSGADDGTGQGLANADRVAQANALVTFANQFQTDRGVTRTFLVGDFNAYSHEDPIDVLEGAGFNELHSTTDPDEESYNFDGQIGSLDHVLANAGGRGRRHRRRRLADQRLRVRLLRVQPVQQQHHRPLRQQPVPVVRPQPGDRRHRRACGGRAGHARHPDPGDERLPWSAQNDGAGPTAGAAVLAGAVKQLRAANPDTVFAAAGDLIGASTFESFIQHDKPTIDALNEAGLEVSAAGNHEFDQGYHDLLDRVMAAVKPEQPVGWRELGVHRGQPAAAHEPEPARAGADVRPRRSAA